MKKHILIVFILFGIHSNCVAMDEQVTFINQTAKAEEVYTKTPCPFINILVNHMIQEGKLAEGNDHVLVDDFVATAVNVFNINETVAQTLANRRANEDGTLSISDLLDPSKPPVHKGSLARKDPLSSSDFAKVDFNRLNELKNNSNYWILHRNKKYTSFNQLQAYQRYCWSLSENMGCTDEMIGKAELNFLWEFFSAYQTTINHITYIPLDLIYNALGYAKLPENFEASDSNPSLWGTLISAFF